MTLPKLSLFPARGDDRWATLSTPEFVSRIGVELIQPVRTEVSQRVPLPCVVKQNVGLVHRARNSKSPLVGNEGQIRESVEKDAHSDEFIPLVSLFPPT